MSDPVTAPAVPHGPPAPATRCPIPRCERLVDADVGPAGGRPRRYCSDEHNRLASRLRRRFRVVAAELGLDDPLQVAAEDPNFNPTLSDPTVDPAWARAKASGQARPDEPAPVTTARRHLADLGDLIADLGAQLTESSPAALQRRIEIAEAVTAELHGQLAAERAGWVRARAEILAQLDAAVRDREDAEESANAAEQRQIVVETELSDTTAALTEARQALDVASAAAAALEVEVSDLEVALGQANAARGDAERSLAELDAQLVTLRVTHVETTGALTRDLTAADAARQVAEARLQDLTGQLEAARARAAEDRQSAASELGRTRSEAAQQAADLRAQRDRLIADVERMRTALERAAADRLADAGRTGNEG